MPPSLQASCWGRSEMAFPSQSQVACFGDPLTPPHFLCGSNTHPSTILWSVLDKAPRRGDCGHWGASPPQHVMPFWSDPLGGPLTSPPREEQPGQGLQPRGRVCEDRAGCLMRYLQDQVDTLTFQSQSLRDRARRFEEALRKNTEEQLEVP